ncbi:patatin-like phospholipase family protein [Methylovirgula sp. 4M-Z18]|uniref:patatin-like phospholipase family protein n=1 Tax=Methylovirgula sp. 4M-Z18 TaxID=2293567 RepID=UPI000E2F3161|nr:patatin-like phospholipase family protein [Methylovirgula sp. 4M-Z18]RFB78832.1 patatin-like phospholipase family protein [Methylovirgula sp. 4M-Z18]
MSKVPVRHAKPERKGPTRIALALGGGGARGLAHILVIEALDELGLRPDIIAGTSMGAIVGAAYAAGMSGHDIRHHVATTMRDRADVMARVLRARVGTMRDMFRQGLNNPMLVDAEVLLDLFWPEIVPDRFEDLRIPFVAVATDFFGRKEAVFKDGLLAPAVAASMAIPGLLKPVHAMGLTLVDGGCVNPLPYDHLPRSMFSIACDVSGGLLEGGRGIPGALEATIGAVNIMQTAILAQKLKVHQPDLLVCPQLNGIRALDFFKTKEILKASEPIKDEIKRGLGARLEQA